MCDISPLLKPQQLLVNLGLFKKKQMTYAGALLLCHSASRVVPGASINCCLFQGTTTTRILDQKIFDVDFLSNYHATVNYLLSHLNTAYEIGFERKERLELPEGALREALLNAMGHRDYRKPGDLQVHIFQDRVEITNPGGLVGGLTLETLGTRSIPRNPLLFGMMLRMDLVEKVGSGLKRIRNMCEQYPCRTQIIEADKDWYRIIFHRQDSKTAGEVTPQVTGEVTGEVRKILMVTSGEMKRKELQSALGLKHEDHFRKAYLIPAINAGFIEMTIPDKPRSSKQKYRLTPKGKKIIKKV